MAKAAELVVNVGVIVSREMAERATRILNMYLADTGVRPIVEVKKRKDKIDFFEISLEEERRPGNE